MTPPESVDFMSFDDLPDTRPVITDGEYAMRIVNPTLKTKKDGNGQYINYDAVVQEGPNAGYRIFGNMFSLDQKNAWNFKGSLKAAGFSVPKGLSIQEAADFFVKNANGFEFVGTVIKKPATQKDESGEYVPVDGQFQNQVKRWLRAVA